jgi:hypothetical protein
LEEDGKKMLITVPKFNYCNLRLESEKFFALQYLIAEFAKKGNLTTACPISPGYRYIRNQFVDDKSLQMFLFNQPDKSEYRISLNVTDENGKKIKKILDMNVFIKYVKNAS